MPCGEVGERLVVVQQPLPQSFEAAVSRARLRGAAFDLAEAAADRRRIDVAHQATDVLHQIGRAHVWNSSHLVISYAVFRLKKKKAAKEPMFAPTSTIHLVQRVIGNRVNIV